MTDASLTPPPPNGPPSDALSLEAFSALAQRIEQEVARVIVGQREVVRDALIGIIAGRHVLLEGVPGLGKTMLIRTLAAVLDLRFSRIQFTPDLRPSDVVGVDILEETEDGRRVRRFQPGPVFANLVLADEINRATPKTQSAMLEVMQEKTVTIGTSTYPLAAPFFVLATQNPLEQEGTYPLPEAQLDRFMFKVQVNFPRLDELVTILDRTTAGDEPTPQKVATGDDVLAMGALARLVPVPTHLSEYVARLVVASHPDGDDAPPRVREYVRYGASPRAAQAIITGSKIHALLEGRFNVAYDDIAAVAAGSLRHRLLLNFDGLAEGISPDGLVADLLQGVPRQKALARQP